MIIKLKQFQNLGHAQDHGPGGFVWAEPYKDRSLRCQIYFPVIMPDENEPRIRMANLWTTIHKWNGNRDCPSFHPSLAIRMTWGKNRDVIDLWHGYVISGLASQNLDQLSAAALSEDVAWFNSHK